MSDKHTEECKKHKAIFGSVGCTCNGTGKLDSPREKIAEIKFAGEDFDALYGFGYLTKLGIDKIIALFPDIVAKLKQAVKDTRDGKDIDLPEELYEVFCSIQNQAIEEAKKGHSISTIVDVGNDAFKDGVKAERERISIHLDKLCKHNPIRTGALRQELGKYIQTLKEEKEETHD